MRERVVRVEAPEGSIDVVGTGGDGAGTFNISTTAALVVASLGVPVAKHGNRAFTSKSGSADVLDALGIRIDHDAVSAAEALRVNNFAFLFAQAFHPAMRHAGPTRREMGVRTAFNLLGPLTNPAGATRALIGVGVTEAAPKIAEVAQRLGTERTFIIHGDGVDELPLDDTGVLYVVTPDGIERHEIKATKLGFTLTPTRKLAGGTAVQNAKMVEDVLRGEPGARRDVVLLNAGAALLVAGVVDRLEDGVDKASLAIDAGMAEELLGALRMERTDPRGGLGRGGGRVSTRQTKVQEIAARRLADVRPELDAIGKDGLRMLVAAAPAPRDVARALAAPGLHLIAEVKRSSPVSRCYRGRRRRGRPRPCLCRRRRGRDLRPVRAPLVRGLRGRPARRACVGRGARPGQGVRGGPAAARPGAWRRCGSRAPARRPAYAEAAGQPRGCGAGPRHGAARRGA